MNKQESDKMKEELKFLCVEMIKLFDEKKSKGQISPEEYREHTEVKKRFLEIFFEDREHLQ